MSELSLNERCVDLRRNGISRATNDAALPRVRGLFDERFCRMWRFYLAGCEAAFRHGDLVVFQIQIARRKDAAPLTRDYLLQAAWADRQKAEQLQPATPK